MENKNFDFSIPSSWLEGTGQFSDIILSSRIRINRNIKNRKFVSWSSNQELQELTDNLFEVVPIINYFKNSYSFKFGSERWHNSDLFPERFICNYKFINSEFPRGIIIGENEDLSVLINNHDHLNIQVYQSGLNLDDLFLLISKIQDEFENNLNFSYSEQFGYLSSLPTLSGTGMKGSIIVHLPAMLRMGDISILMKTLSHLRCNFSSLFSSGPQIIQGDLFMISNQVTLGITEEEIIDSLSKIAMEMLNYENNAREKLFQLKRYEIEDEIFRSFGVLQNARSITFDETISNLSMVRLGRSLNIIKNIDWKTLNSLLVLLQDRHIEMNFKGIFNKDEKNYKRAELLREALKS